MTTKGKEALLDLDTNKPVSVATHEISAEKIVCGKRDIEELEAMEAMEAMKVIEEI